MKLIAETPGPPPRRFEIVSTEMRDGDHALEWFWVRVYEGETRIDEFLQHTLSYAQERAEARYGVPRSAWRRVEE
jgi:hypothetical protein